MALNIEKSIASTAKHEDYMDPSDTGRQGAGVLGLQI